MDSKAVQSVPEIIRAAASSNLGILALMCLLLAFLAYAFFRNEGSKARIPIFVLLFGGVALYGYAVMVQSSAHSRQINPGSINVEPPTRAESVHTGPVPEAKALIPNATTTVTPSRPRGKPPVQPAPPVGGDVTTRGNYSPIAIGTGGDNNNNINAPDPAKTEPKASPAEEKAKRHAASETRLARLAEEWQKAEKIADLADRKRIQNAIDQEKEREMDEWSRTLP